MQLEQRFWEIDTLRGVAIVMMVTYHLLFDLYYFGIYPFQINTLLLWIFARSTAFIFLLVVGISLTLSYNRAKLRGLYAKKDDNGVMFWKYFKRGLKIFALGILITLVTWVFIPSNFIVFGVLHFIGLAIILEYPFLDKKYVNLVFATIFIVVGIYLGQSVFTGPWLLWLGLKSSGFHTVDYFPLLPWLGVVSLGLFLGNTLYFNYQRQFRLPDFSSHPIIKLTSFLGRHSLLIYLVHQPLLIIILYVTGALELGHLL
ncbi:MAG: DUF1624 domain-containing protein [Methanobacteriaceae archaeon]|nr:DUF1624 domain-containing protein [Methanobacteriaceae archaeon]